MSRFFVSGCFCSIVFGISWPQPILMPQAHLAPGDSPGINWLETDTFTAGDYPRNEFVQTRRTKTVQRAVTAPSSAKATGSVGQHSGRLSPTNACPTQGSNISFWLTQIILIKEDHYILACTTRMFDRRCAKTTKGSSDDLDCFGHRGTPQHQSSHPRGFPTIHLSKNFIHCESTTYVAFSQFHSLSGRADTTVFSALVNRVVSSFSTRRRDQPSDSETSGDKGPLRRTR